MENTLSAIIKGHNNPLSPNIYNYCHKKAKKKQADMKQIQEHKAA